MDIEKQKKLNTFISLHTDESPGKTGGSAATSPLSGVPFALADNICTENLKTTCASRLLETYQPPFSSSAAQKLQAQGAVLAGKTNMDEFGMGTWGRSSHFGPAKNPLAEKHTAGSGAAAAVADGAVSLALAADRWGEVRQAAAYCRILGLKPTYGRVSRNGLIDCAPSLEQLGILAGSSKTMAAALEAISGPDPLDPTSAWEDVPPYGELLQQNPPTLKVAVPAAWSETSALSRETKEAFAAELGELDKSLFQLETIPFQYLEYSLVTALIIGAVEAFSNLSNMDGIRFGLRGGGKHLQEMYRLTRTEGFSSQLKELLTFGALVSSGKYYNDYFLRAQKMRTLIKDELDACLQQYDLILLPATPFPAPLLENGIPAGILPDTAATYTAAANLAGIPALTVPLPSRGDTAEKLPPTGLQFMAKGWDENLLLQTARIFEQDQT